MLAGGLFALEYVLLGALLLGEHVSASFLVSAHGLLRSLFAGRRKQGTVES